MKAVYRQRIELAIDALVALLDEIDGDADFEPEPPEEQHDAEAVEYVNAPPSLGRRMA